MEILIYGLTLISTTLLIVILHQLLFSGKSIITSRLQSIRIMGHDYEDDDDMKKPFIDRVITPIMEKIVNTIGKFTPKGIRQKYETLIMHSGRQKTMNASNLFTIQFLSAILFGGLTYFLSVFINVPSIFFSVLVAFLGWIIPFVLYSSRARVRQEEIQYSLPSFLDLLYVSVEAGLAFDMAMKRSAEKMSGALAEEIRFVLDDISKGRNRSEALRSLTKRTGVDDLNTFVTAVIQADQLGSNIANMLRVQSMSARTRRRQRVEQSVAKLPIKMIFPLVFFFLPAIFIIILGPAVLNVIDAMRDMY